MTVEIVKFSKSHVDLMDLTPSQKLEEGHKEALGHGDAWTVMVDGHPVASGGLIEVWKGRGYAWALMARDSGPYMLHITRAVRRGLAISAFRRVELVVKADFDAGCRWAEMLGFVRETPVPLRAYLPDGGDAWLYAKVN